MTALLPCRVCQEQREMGVKHICPEAFMQNERRLLESATGGTAMSEWTVIIRSKTEPDLSLDRLDYYLKSRLPDYEVVAVYPDRLVGIEIEG